MNKGFGGLHDLPTKKAGNDKREGQNNMSISRHEAHIY